MGGGVGERHCANAQERERERERAREKKKKEREREKPRESALAPPFICFFLHLGLPYANWA